MPIFSYINVISFLKLGLSSRFFVLSPSSFFSEAAGLYLYLKQILTLSVGGLSRVVRRSVSRLAPRDILLTIQLYIFGCDRSTAQQPASLQKCGEVTFLKRYDRTIYRSNFVNFAKILALLCCFGSWFTSEALAQNTQNQNRISRVRITNPDAISRSIDNRLSFNAVDVRMSKWSEAFYFVFLGFGLTGGLLFIPLSASYLCRVAKISMGR